MHFNSPGFFYFLRKEKSMLVHYKKNRKPACYDSDSLVSVGKILPDEHPRGPFKSCGNCPYPSHGFICYSLEGDCLRTDMQRKKITLTTNIVITCDDKTV